MVTVATVVVSSGLAYVVLYTQVFCAFYTLFKIGECENESDSTRNIIEINGWSAAEVYF